ncbi:MAG: hypothetical protein NTX50_31635, partial [Candidatus Sumerlaeota bacterium]|nr:hypothetical protein [Candidatus Sumerlaeota bacterium]
MNENQNPHSTPNRRIIGPCHFGEPEGYWQRAMDDFSAIINMPNVPDFFKIEALLSRAHCYRKRRLEGDWQGAVDDYSTIINMPEAWASAAYARYLRADIYFLREPEGDWRSALDDCSAVIDMHNAAAELKAPALLMRGGIYKHRAQVGGGQVGD